MKVKNIMESASDVLTPETSLKDAIVRMRTANRSSKQKYPGVKGMIVVDRPGHPVGMLSMLDILREIIPWYLKEDLGSFAWDGMLEAMARKVADRPVGEIMNRKLITVNQNAPLMECAELMGKHNRQRLPVLDDGGSLVGIIYLRDLYYAIVKAFTGEEK